MNEPTQGGTAHVGEPQTAKRIKQKSQKVREKESQAREVAEQQKVAAAATAKRVATRQQNLIHDPTPAEVQAFVNDPAQQAARETAMQAQYQDLAPSARLNLVRADKRALHTNQLAIQMHQSQQALQARATHPRPPTQESQAAAVTVTTVNPAGPSNSAVSLRNPAERTVAGPAPIPAGPPGHVRAPRAHPQLHQSIRHPTNMINPTPAQIVSQHRTTPRPPDRKGKKRNSNQKRPTLAKLEGNRGPLLAKAAEYYTSYIMAKDPCALSSQQWAEMAMRDACHDLQMIVVESPTAGDLRILSGRHSNIRKTFLDATRKFVPSMYKIWEPSGDDSGHLAGDNARNVERLLSESLFAHENVSTPVGSGPYMNRIFYAIIKECAFKSSQSCGVRHAIIWETVTLELMAYLATMVEKVLREWSPGTYTATPFIVNDQKQTYLAHLKQLREQRGLCPAVMDRYYRSLILDARNALGSGPDLSQPPQSGVSSTSIQIWARQFTSNGIVATSGGASQGSDDQSFNFSQYTGYEPTQFDSQSDSYGFEGSLAGGSFVEEATLQLPVQGSLSQSTYALTVEHQASGSTSSSISLGASQPVSGAINYEHTGSHTDLTFGSTQATANDDTQTISKIDSYVTLRPSQSISQVIHKMALPQAPVDDNTQTVTETESYETLRPSQLVSQVRHKADAVGAPAINGASRFNYQLPSPPTTFEHQAATWQNDWIESRSVSQAHDEQFEALYPLPPRNDAS